MITILVDMNLSVDWERAFARAGITAVHWSVVGDPRADDRTIMEWARRHGALVFTHDLDFGTILALTHAAGPSVVLLRTQDNLPCQCAAAVIDVLHRHEQELKQGAILVIDEQRSKIRILPI